MNSKRNVIYYNAHRVNLARTLIAAHHSFGFFARKGGVVDDHGDRDI